MMPADRNSDSNAAAEALMALMTGEAPASEVKEDGGEKSEVVKEEKSEQLLATAEKTQGDAAASEKKQVDAASQSKTETKGIKRRINEHSSSPSASSTITAPGKPAKTQDEPPAEPKSPPRSPPRKLKRPSAAARRPPPSQQREQHQQQRGNTGSRNEQERRGEQTGFSRSRTYEAAAAQEIQRRSVDSVVRQHYNARPDMGVSARQSSPIIKLKSFNNFIKSVIIKRFARRDDVVLDMGCGKGGDLLKWDIAGIRGYVGIDIADVSVRQAEDRFRKMRRKRFWAEFMAGDAFSMPLTAHIPRDMYQAVFPVDVVTMQFCMHYAFETEAKARQMLENVSRSLRRGGKFIGTIPSSDAIVEHIQKLPPGEKEWGNSVYRVRFFNDPPRDGMFRPPFGHRYSFFLEDAVEDVPEYVVPFEVFRAMAEDYKLELVYRKGFHEVFEDETSEHPELFDIAKRMDVVKSDGTFGIEGDQREAAGFYLAFAFEKLAG